MILVARPQAASSTYVVLLEAVRLMRPNFRRQPHTQRKRRKSLFSWHGPHFYKNHASVNCKLSKWLNGNNISQDATNLRA